MDLSPPEGGRRRGTLLCFGVPVALLVFSYGWLAVERGEVALWHSPIHESGDYSLAETVLYYRHFLREVPVDLAMALFLFGAFLHAPGPHVRRPLRRRAVVVTWGALLAALLLVGLAWARVASDLGWDEAWRELFQFRTRDDLMGYGSHWHFHWLSTIWFGASAQLLAPWVARLFDRERFVPPRRNLTLSLVPWLYVVLLTCVFGIPAETFVDPRYTGHQAREIFTHGIVTCSLGFGFLHVSSAWLSRPTRSGAPSRGSFPRGSFACLLLFFVIPIWLTVITLRSDVMAVGQSQHGLAPMIAGHFFEHTMDYAFVALLVVAGNSAVITCGRSRRQDSTQPSRAPRESTP